MIHDIVNTNISSRANKVLISILLTSRGVSVVLIYAATILAGHQIAIGYVVDLIECHIVSFGTPSFLFELFEQGKETSCRQLAITACLMFMAVISLNAED